MQLRFGGLSIAEWDELFRKSDAAKHLKDKSVVDRPVNNQMAEATQHEPTLTWSQRLRNWQVGPRYPQDSSWFRYRSKYTANNVQPQDVKDGPRILHNGTGKQHEVTESRPESKASTELRVAAPPTKEDKREKAPNVWHQQERKGAILRPSPYSNGYSSPSSAGAAKVFIDGVDKGSYSHVMNGDKLPSKAYATDFPNALANGKALNGDTSKEALFASDYDYEGNREELLELSKNKQIASGLPIMPVGLVNPSSTCYMNVIIQALFSCRYLVEILVAKKSNYQSTLLEKLRLFYLRIAEHEKVEEGRQWPSSLLPSLFYNVFPPTNSNSSNNKSFSQEDAQEFLVHILNTMHEQIVRAQEAEKARKPYMNGTKSVLDWSLVGMKGRRIRDFDMYNTGDQQKTMVSDMFGGLTLTEVVRTAKDKLRGDSHNKHIERFYSLGLEAGNGTSSVEEGLKRYFAEEKLENGMVKSIDIVMWPKVLIIHLMRFCYKKETNEVEKITAKCHYPELLHVEDSARVAARGRERRRRKYEYRLVAVVTHHGKDIASGHYTCDVWRRGKSISSNDGEDSYGRMNGRARRLKGSKIHSWFREDSGWYNCDDSKMSEVSLEEVLHRQAYLLFYELT